MPTILTGLRSNANLHLGNYIGGILPMVNLQKNLQPNDQFLMFVPDLHSFTTPIDYSILYHNSLENLRIYLAAGVDFEDQKSIFYRQSYVPAHSELAWILSCFTYFGEASKMTQFKDKKDDLENKNEPVSVGLFTYPILMAADILLYNAEFVPLGEDQQQHLELARDLAIRLNNKFKDQFTEGIFTVPKSWKDQLEFTNRNEGVRIRSLQNPEKKMSKSIVDPKGTILLIDEPKTAAKKIMSATTDSLANINWDWQNQPGITNLMQIYAFLSSQSIEETKQIWEGQTKYGDLKKEVANLVEEFLTSFQARLTQIDEQKVLEILEKGEQKANEIAKETLRKVQRAVGVRR